MTKKAAGISLMLVDDHPMWRQMLRKVLEHSSVGHVVAEASTGREALERARETSPDLIVMDINLPGMDGIQATRTLTAERPDLKILVLSSSDERPHVLEAVAAGASGYVLKTAGPKEVAEAVRRVHRGEIVLPPDVGDVVMNEFRRLRSGGPDVAPVRLVVADASEVIRRGFAHVLEEAGFDVLGQSGSVADTIDLVRRTKPDVIVLDARLAGSVAEEVRALAPEAGLLMLGNDSDEVLPLIGEDTYKVGYLLKERIDDVDELTETIRRIAAGESVVDPGVAGALVDQPGKRTDALAQLSEREREVLALMAEGRSNQAISERLYLGVKTVEAHVRSIFAKLGLEPAGDDHRRVLAVITYLRSV